jgi:hypothetical protein
MAKLASGSTQPPEIAQLERERDEFLDYSRKVQRKQKISGKLKRFFLRRPKKEELPYALDDPEVTPSLAATAAAAAAPAPPVSGSFTGLSQQHQQDIARWVHAAVPGMLPMPVPKKGPTKRIPRPRTTILGMRSSIFLGEGFAVQKQQQQRLR